MNPKFLHQETKLACDVGVVRQGCDAGLLSLTSMAQSLSLLSSFVLHLSQRTVLLFRQNLIND